MTLRTPYTALIPTLLCSALPALAQNTQAPDDIRRAAERHVVAQTPVSEGHKLQAVAEALDPRLRLAQCEQALQGVLPASARTTGARITVGVSCAQPKWTVYVPVRVETQMPVLVLRNSAARNASLMTADVELRTQRVPGLATTYINNVEQLAGRHLRQPVAAGTPLSVEMLAADVLVRRGQRVTLVAKVGGIEVRAQGEAIGDANAAGRVRVLNLNSRRVVEGQVESRDVVSVSL